MLIGHDLTAQLRAEDERRRRCGSPRWRPGRVDLDLRQMTWSDELYELAGVDPETFTPTFLSPAGRCSKPSERPGPAGCGGGWPTIPQFRFTFEIVRPSDGVRRWLEIEGHRLADGDRHARHRARRDDAAARGRPAARARRAAPPAARADAAVRGGGARPHRAGAARRHGAAAWPRSSSTSTASRWCSAASPPAATTLVAETRSALSDALERTRHLMFELRPQRFDRHGLRRRHHRALRAGRRRGRASRLSVDVPDTRFDGVIEDLCYRTVREAVINARKHSGADHLWVSADVQRPGRIHGVVRDDGAGFDPRTAATGRTCGCTWASTRWPSGIRLAGRQLRGRERARRQGCIVSFSIPVTEAPAGRWDGVV